jgi:hypothetical protein
MTGSSESGYDHMVGEAYHTFWLLHLSQALSFIKWGLLLLCKFYAVFCYVIGLPNPEGEGAIIN